MRLYGKSTCTTCRDAKAYLCRLGVEFDWRDYGKQPFTAAELSRLMGRRKIEDFINPRSTPYRNLGLSASKLSKAQAVDLILEEVNLLKRPLLVAGSEYVFGFDKGRYQELACLATGRR